MIVRMLISSEESWRQYLDSLITLYVSVIQKFPQDVMRDKAKWQLIDVSSRLKISDVSFDWWKIIQVIFKGNTKRMKRREVSCFKLANSLFFFSFPLLNSIDGAVIICFVRARLPFLTPSNLCYATVIDTYIYTREAHKEKILSTY